MAMKILIGSALLLLALSVYFVVNIILSRRPMESHQAEKVIKQNLDDIVEKNKAVRNAFVAVDAPKLGIQVRHASGMSGPMNPITADSLFHTASVGKLATAATVLSMVQDGILNLDEPINTYVDTSPYSGMLTIDGQDRLGGLTLRELLTHRTGLADHFTDRSADGSPNTMELVLQEPGRTWTIESRLAYVKNHFKPMGIPGKETHYADTNFDLLGLVVKETTGKPFEDIRRDRVLLPSGMKNSLAWPPKDMAGYSQEKIADLWLEDTEISSFPSLDIDGPGGGLAVSLEDLIHLMRAIVEGQSLPALESFYPENDEWGQFIRGIDYGNGLMAIRPGKLSPFMTGYPDLYGHSGLTGSYVYYVPQYDAVIAGSFNTSDWGQRRHIIFILKVLNYLRRVAEKAGKKTFN